MNAYNQIRGRILQKQEEIDEETSIYIISAYCFLVVIVIVCILFLIYKKCKMRREREQQSAANNLPDFDRVLPDITFKLLERYVVNYVFPKLSASQTINYFNSFTDCVICLQNFENEDPNGNHPVKLTLCSHLYHNNCLIQWMNKEAFCPTCRQKLDKDSISTLGEQMGINFDQLYNKHLQQQKKATRTTKIKSQKKKSKNPMVCYRPQMTRSEIEMEEQPDQQQLVQILEPMEIFAIKLYRIVLSHHKKQQEALQKSRFTRQTLALSKKRSSLSRRHVIISFDEDSENIENRQEEGPKIQYSEQDNQ